MGLVYGWCMGGGVTTQWGGAYWGVHNVGRGLPELPPSLPVQNPLSAPPCPPTPMLSSHPPLCLVKAAPSRYNPIYSPPNQPTNQQTTTFQS